HPFSRSYGVILPSSLTRVRSLTLGCSPRLPVSVCGTGCLYLTRNFSWQCDVSSFGTIFPSSSQLVFNTKHFTLCQTHCLNTNPITCSAYPPASFLWSNNTNKYRNLNLLSIAYTFRSRLRSRLTLGGRAFPRKP